MRYRLLDPLRGLAALWVLAFHFRSSTASQAAFPLFESLTRIGYLGVPMFFVISGYCITGAARTTIQRRDSTSRFLYRRVRRIIPPYWGSLLVVLLLPFLLAGLSALKAGRYYAPHPNYLQFTGLEWARIASLTQVFATVPGAQTLDAKFTAINAVYWTLAIEMQFYLVMGLALAARRWFYPIVAIVTVASVPVAFLASAYNTGLFLPYWPMFAVGVALFVAFERGFAPSVRLGARAVWWAVVAVGIAALACVWLAGIRGPVDGLAFAAGFGVVLYLGEGLDAAYGAARRHTRALVRVPVGLLAALGAMSYSLYLLHAPVLFLAKQVSREIVRPNSIAHDVLAVLLTTAVGYLFYLACERPFAGSDRAVPQQPPPAPVEIAKSLAF